MPAGNSSDSIELRGFCLAGGAFWASARSVGAAEEEAIALCRGELSAVRQAEIKQVMEQAMFDLAEILPAGVGEWMPLRRAMS